MVENKPTHS